MRMLILAMVGGQSIAIEPEHVTHVQREASGSTLLWLDNDNMPTVIDLDFIEVVAQLNEAIEDQTPGALQVWNEQSAQMARDLMKEIQRLQWAFGIACIIAFILLAVIMARS